MKYEYSEEKNRNEIIFAFIICIIVLLFCVLGITKSPMNTSENSYDAFSKEWWETIIVIVLVDTFVIGTSLHLGAKRKRIIRWHSFLIEKGIKCNGYVKEITYIANFCFKFKIGYYSELEKKEINFYTPSIIIKNLDYNKKIICDVYEIAQQYEKEYHKKSFESVMAVNFRYES